LTDKPIRRVTAIALLAVMLIGFSARPSSAQPEPAGSTAPRDALQEVANDLSSLREEIEDTTTAVEEFDMFDQCMYLLGATSFGSTTGPGLRFVDPTGATDLRAALALDMRSFTPGFDFLAFPGEEPPQIECNEDAGGENTDE
jgi:hypothetical protein